MMTERTRARLASLAIVGIVAVVGLAAVDAIDLDEQSAIDAETLTIRSAVYAVEPVVTDPIVAPSTVPPVDDAAETATSATSTPGSLSPGSDGPVGSVTHTAERLAGPIPDDTVPTFAFRRDDCTWVRDGLTYLGLRPEWVDFGVRMAEREGQCCPNVQGGDRVDESCNVTHVARWDHRSDSGVFQFNRVWYRGDDTRFCADLGVCDQATILADPGLQLELFVFAVATCGRGPWDKAGGYWCEPADVLVDDRGAS